MSRFALLAGSFLLSIPSYGQGLRCSFPKDPGPDSNRGEIRLQKEEGKQAGKNTFTVTYTPMHAKGERPRSLRARGMSCIFSPTDGRVAECLKMIQYRKRRTSITFSARHMQDKQVISPTGKPEDFERSDLYISLIRPDRSQPLPPADPNGILSNVPWKETIERMPLEECRAIAD